MGTGGSRPTFPPGGEVVPMASVVAYVRFAACEDGSALGAEERHER